MIVRIATDRQYELDGGDERELNELDNETVAAAEAGDEARFEQTYKRLLEFIRSRGQPVGDDVLRPSDVILPPPDVSLEEAKAEFSGEGLIPDEPRQKTP